MTIIIFILNSYSFVNSIATNILLIITAIIRATYDSPLYIEGNINSERMRQGQGSYEIQGKSMENPHKTPWTSDEDILITHAQGICFICLNWIGYKVKKIMSKWKFVQHQLPSNLNDPISDQYEVSDDYGKLKQLC